MSQEHRDSGRYVAQYDSLIHLPTTVDEPVARIDGVGEIYHYELSTDNTFDPNSVEIPDYVQEATRNRPNRIRLTSVLHLNSRQTRFEWLGKANSCFISKQASPNGIQYSVDIFRESPENERSDSPVLHTYLREHFDYPNTALPILGPDSRCVCLSGHIAPVVISSKDVAQVMSLDYFSNENTYELLNPAEKQIIKTLWHNRIMPVSNKGRIIKPNNGHS